LEQAYPRIVESALKNRHKQFVIDGEAVILDAPLRFRILPGVLRVRIARSHPGASPSAAMPDSVWEGLAALVGIAGGRAQAPR